MDIVVKGAFGALPTLAIVFFGAGSAFGLFTNHGRVRGMDSGACFDLLSLCKYLGSDRCDEVEVLWGSSSDLRLLH